VEQVPQPGGRRSTTPPGFGPDVHDGVRPLSDVLALHNRVQDMGLSREAAQSSFLYSREPSERAARGLSNLDSVEDTLTQAMPSLSWNDAKRRDAHRRAGRSQSADGDLDRGTSEEISTGLGITGIVIEQGPSRDPPTRYQTSSTVPLPKISVSPSVVESLSDEFECDPGEDGILGGDEGDEDEQYAEGDDVESDEDDEEEEEGLEDQEQEEEDTDEEEEGERDDDIPEGDSQNSYSTMLCDSDGQQIPAASVTSRKPRQLMDLPPFRESSGSPAAVSAGAVQHQPSFSGMLRDTWQMDVDSGDQEAGPYQTGGKCQ
jgi:hypothetical protein